MSAKTVTARVGDVVASSSHRCCAERNVIDAMVTLATRKGVRHMGIAHWIRRKIGARMIIERFLCDDTPACCLPCVLCRRSIERLGISIRCTVDTADGCVFAGHMDDAPPSKLTTSQRRIFQRR